MTPTRPRKLHTLPLLTGTAALALVSCDIDQTQAGELPDVEAESGELPEYEVVKTDEGEMPGLDVEGGQMPAYDVDWMDVDVKLEERTVSVPKLKLVVEEETVEVPTLNVDWPGDEEVVERRIQAQVETPHAGFSFNIEEVFAADDELIVISRLEQTGSPGAQPRPQRHSDYIIVNAPDMSIERYVIGSRPDRDFNDDLEFISSRRELADELDGARQIYARE